MIDRRSAVPRQRIRTWQEFDVGKRLAAAAMNHVWGMTIGIALAGFSLATTTAGGSLVAVPGKPGVTTARNDRVNKLASQLIERVSDTANKIGEGIKSALGKPDKKPTTASADKGDTGSSEDTK
ncbi:hypothetical protein ACNQVK_34020 [Mycobacterium sp. 134]|uniref:hypothetical protein n=1 Tax=Mycobacterium sp. 134 TaxID=3400425 RepID=UPI003AADEE51